MRTVRLLSVAVVVVVAAGIAPSGAASPSLMLDPCTMSMADPAGDGVYGVGFTAAPLKDDDLDVTRSTVHITATTVVFTDQVVKLNTSGPTFGTGHGMRMALQKYGTTIGRGGTRDSAFGDYDSPGAAGTPGSKLSLDAAANTFRLTVSRADLAKASNSADLGGTFRLYSTNTTRTDPSGYAGTLGQQGTGRDADLVEWPDSAVIDLDACDQFRRATLTVRTRVLTAGYMSVVVQLQAGDGTPIKGERVAVTVDGRRYLTSPTSPAGLAQVKTRRGLSITASFAGNADHDAATASVG